MNHLKLLVLSIRLPIRHPPSVGARRSVRLRSSSTRLLAGLVAFIATAQNASADSQCVRFEGDTYRVVECPEGCEPDPSDKWPWLVLYYKNGISDGASDHSSRANGEAS